MVNLQLQKSEHDDPITISALTFPVICSPLAQKFTQIMLTWMVWSWPMSLIHLLIDSDFYWNFVTGETRQGEEGPTAVNSTLGWRLLFSPISGTIDRSYNMRTNLIIDCQNSLFQQNFHCVLDQFYDNTLLD